MDQYYLCPEVLEQLFPESINGVTLPLPVNGLYLQGKILLNSQNLEDQLREDTVGTINRLGIYDQSDGSNRAYIEKAVLDEYIERNYPRGVIVKTPEVQPLTSALEKSIEGETYSQKLIITVNVTTTMAETQSKQFLVNDYLVLLPAFQQQVGAVKAFLIETAATGYGITNKDRQVIDAFDVASMDKRNIDFVQLAVAVEARNRIFSDSGTRWRSATIMSQITRRAQRLALHFIQTSILSRGSV